ncbi:regulatory helix-turn-helix protein, lysR family [Vreelandella subterranea]|uniref:Regulatory helix-turn-helix protein, lysR family n=1 Tax=Vreelandella subterranea TaxID=416874 RepID=A0A1H9PBC7_9GAMM|nr:LysR family transcriptional regulator [Halomonas subterranea]SER45506.1 regulatory helix-turn-helix protein, lysR family [Halomonas subterranea]
MGTLPPLRALQVFEAIGRYSSVTEAAGWLGISPAAVSQHIKQLEAHLKMSLVEREGRRLRMTRAGGKGANAGYRRADADSKAGAVTPSSE